MRRIVRLLDGLAVPLVGYLLVWPVRIMLVVGDRGQTIDSNGDMKAGSREGDGVAGYWLASRSECVYYGVREQ